MPEARQASTIGAAVCENGPAMWRTRVDVPEAVAKPRGLVEAEDPGLEAERGRDGV